MVCNRNAGSEEMNEEDPPVEEEVELEAFVVDWVPVLVKAGLAPSRSAAHRLIEAGALRVDGFAESRYIDFLLPGLLAFCTNLGQRVFGDQSSHIPGHLPTTE